MRIAFNNGIGQLSLINKFLFFIVCALLFSACNVKKEDGPVIPPITAPLSREYIGYGVITASFTHLTANPEEGSPSIGYLRRGSLVRIVRRQTIKTQNVFVTWVLTDGTADDTNTAGWLKDEVMDIYDNESQARTASESMPR